MKKSESVNNKASLETNIKNVTDEAKRLSEYMNNNTGNIAIRMNTRIRARKTDEDFMESTGV